MKIKYVEDAIESLIGKDLSTQTDAVGCTIMI